MFQHWQFKLNRHDDPEPAPDTAPDPTPDTGTEVDWKAEAEKFKALARKHEDRAKANVTAAQQAEQYKQQFEAMLKAAGVKPDGTPADDPAAVAAQLAQRAEHAEALAFQNGVKFNVHQAATELGGDAARLLDSMSFIDTLDDLAEAGTDPGSPEFAAAVKAKVAAAIESNPAYKVSGPAGPRPDPGQGTRPPVVTDFNDADHETWAKEARKYGIRPRTY